MRRGWRLLLWPGVILLLVGAVAAVNVALLIAASSDDPRALPVTPEEEDR